MANRFEEQHDIHPPVVESGRRRLLLVSLLGGLATKSALAQRTYPSRPITIIVPFAAGGFSDTVARSVGARLSTRLNVSVVVENKPGGNTFIAAGAVAKAPPDGYTLFLANISTMAIIPTVQKNVPFEVRDELDPIGLVAMSPNVIAVNADLPIRTAKDLVAYAKANDVKFGTPGMGSTGHLAGEMLAQRANVTFRHIPYKGSPAVLPDIVNGNLQFTVDNLLTWAPLVKGGRVRAIAVTGSSRSALLPDVPTMEESGFPDYLSTSWFGLAAPRGTPAAIVARLNEEVNAIVEMPEFRAHLSGAEFRQGDVEQFRKFIAAERQKWGDVARAINLKID